MKRVLLILFILLVGYSTIYAKTEKFGTWIELTFTKKFLKDFEFSIIPEFRLQDNFTLDEYIFEGKLSYEPFKFLEFAAGYRYITNVKDKGNEVTHSGVFDATGKKEFNRFKGSLRARFTNDTDFGDPWATYYFRPRAKLTYNIKGIKAEPYISYEVFHSFRDKTFYKGRLDVGISYKFNKHNEIGLYYRLNDFYVDRSSISILGIDYGFKF